MCEPTSSITTLSITKFWHARRDWQRLQFPVGSSRTLRLAIDSDRTSPASLHSHASLRYFGAQSLPLLFGQLFRFENDDNSFQRSTEFERHLIRVVLNHRRSRILTNVECLSC